MKNKKKLTKKNILILLLVAISVALVVIFLFVKDDKKIEVMECTITNQVENFANITFDVEFVYDEYVKEQNMKYIYEIVNDSLKTKIPDLAKKMEATFDEKIGDLKFPYDVTYDNDSIYITININYDKIDVKKLDDVSLFPIENIDSLKQTTIDEVVTSIENGGGICVEK